MRISFSKFGILLSLPFLAVAIFDGFEIAKLLTNVHENSRIGIFMFAKAAFPWDLIFDPIMKKIVVFSGSRSAEPLYIYWLICTALNTVFVYMAGSLVNKKRLSHVAAILSGLYFLPMFLVWIILSFFWADSTGHLIVYLYIGGGPFYTFLSIVIGKYGGLIAIIYNAVLIYCFVGLFSESIGKFINRSFFGRTRT